MKEYNWNPRSYGIATRTKKFSEWGVGDEVWTHLGRKALTHGQPVQNGRNVRVTFLDATGDELINGTDLPMHEIAKHIHWRHGYERSDYVNLTTRREEAIEQAAAQQAAAQRVSEPKRKKKGAAA